MEHPGVDNLKGPLIMRYTPVMLLILTFFLPFSSFATTHENPFSAEQRNAIEEIIGKFILENPKVIMKSVQKMEARQQQDKALRVEQTLVDRSEDLVNDPGSHVGGNPNGDITLIEFFDYQCGYCKQVHPTVRKLLKEDGNIRLVYKEFPILGPASVYAARAAIASRAQGKYLEFHDALMELKGPLSKVRILKTATSIGLDAIRLAKDVELNEQDTDSVMRITYGLAEDLDISGTPAFIVGSTVIRGAADLASLKDAIANGRSDKKAQGG